MKILRTKIFFYIFLILFFVIGSLSSLNVGISHDEWHEEQNWKFNIELTKKIKNKFFLNDDIDVNIESNLDKYYGIGFQYISQPIQFILKKKVEKYENVDVFGAKLIAKHFVVFSFFYISGICFFLILKKIIGNRTICYFSTFLYLLYPYLFGHSLFNPKDIPFMSAWLLSTYLSFNIFDKLIKNKILSYSKILIFAFSIAFLLSIRVTGILIFFQILISLLIFLNVFKINLKNFLKIYFKKLFFFFFSLILFILILNPVYWLDPFSFVKAIIWMSDYYHDVCTYTLGSCMKAKDLPPTYIFIWLMVKLPLMIILGILLIPFTEKSIFNNNKNKVFFGSLLATIMFIPLLLIFIRSNIYDEIRHIMFLMPLIFLTGTISLYYFSKKFFLVLTFLSLSLFIYENIKIFPYQYIWFNTPSRYLDLTSKFELDYMGISGKELSKTVLKKNEENLCILSSPQYAIEPFFHNSKFNCFDSWQLIDTNYKRPFLAIQHVRNIKKSTPYNCKTIYDSGFKLLLHQKKFITGKLLKCF